MTGRVDWYGEDVMALINGASADLLTRLALQAEAVAKVHPAIPVDTGFMRNAIYGLGPEDSHREEAEASAEAVADRRMAPKIDVGEDSAALHGAARYTLYQEIKHGFMRDAIEQVANITGDEIVKVRREHFGG